VVLAVLAGIGYLLFRIAKALLAHFEKVRQEEQRLHLLAAQEQKILAQQVVAEAERQEQLRKELEEMQQRQRQEEECQQLERLRRAQEDLARQRLEAECNEADQAFAQWNGRTFIKKPSAEQINTIIEEEACVQSHCGKYLHVIVLVGPSGTALKWQAHTGGGCTPLVIGLRGSEQMFSKWAFAGRHAARLAPGRHVLAFRVIQGGQPAANDIDLAFELFVPAELPARGIEQFKKAVGATTKDFVSRAKTVAKAKRTVGQALTRQSDDPDEIQVELSKLEVQIKDLEKDPT
jgi:hypothetical protein